LKKAWVCYSNWDKKSGNSKLPSPLKHLLH